MTHAKTTNYIRTYLKTLGIKCGVRRYVSCGQASINIYVHPHTPFTSEELETIQRVAKNNGCTATRGREIRIGEVCCPDSLHFEFHGV